VTYAFITLFGFAFLLLILLVWVLRAPNRVSRQDAAIDLTEIPDRTHVTFFPQIKQALAVQDSAYLASLGMNALANRVRKERRKIALAYLACMRNDFQRLWRLGRVISSMSPQVGTAQEFRRIQLGLAFSLRYEMIRIKLLIGFAPLIELGALSEVVSRLSIRIETAMQDLGERAVLSAKLASSLDGRGLDVP
jgi:hypothetical protein